jgi:hypothetical protein
MRPYVHIYVRTQKARPLDNRLELPLSAQTGDYLQPYVPSTYADRCNLPY